MLQTDTLCSAKALRDRTAEVAVQLRAVEEAVMMRMQTQWLAGGLVFLGLTPICVMPANCSSFGKEGWEGLNLACPSQNGLTTSGTTDVLAGTTKGAGQHKGGVLSGQELLAQQFQKTDFDGESTELIANVLYSHLSGLSGSVAPSGANGVNAKWESGLSAGWYIEEQRYGEELIIGGLIKNDSAAIQMGFKMFDWGFAHQAADGSFQGTGDPFHSTSFFVAAVAHTLLFLQQSPQAAQYAARIAHYTPLVHRAAQWMIAPDVWKKGIENNNPYTHRRYLVAAALGLTGKLTGDRGLMSFAHQSVEDGLSLQLPDGVNPEAGGYDSSYQMVGVVYAERWVTYFPNEPLTLKLQQ